MFALSKIIFRFYFLIALPYAIVECSIVYLPHFCLWPNGNVVDDLFLTDSNLSKAQGFPYSTSLYSFDLKKRINCKRMKLFYCGINFPPIKITSTVIFPALLYHPEKLFLNNRHWLDDFLWAKCFRSDVKQHTVKQ